MSTVIATHNVQTENVDNSEELKKQEWARQMRLKFTPKDMLLPDGNLNLEYFKPKQTFVKVRKWTERERQLLIKGIEKHGIGNWALIKEELLPDWDSTDLRLKTALLMGRQSLKQYHHWKGSAEAIEREYSLNKQIGEELNCWKGGVLVADDDGKVLARIEELRKAASSDKE